MINFSTSLQRSVVLPNQSKPKPGLVPNATDREFSQSGVDRYKALLVDDNVDLLDLAAVLFRELGFEVHTATNGNEALELLTHRPDFDVLFTDVVMPGISGIQLGHEARKLYPDMKIILVSGYPQQAISAGHGTVHDFDFLDKPYRLDEIARLLRTAH